VFCFRWCGKLRLSATSRTDTSGTRRRHKGASWTAFGYTLKRSNYLFVNTAAGPKRIYMAMRLYQPGCGMGEADVVSPQAKGVRLSTWPRGRLEPGMRRSVHGRKGSQTKKRVIPFSPRLSLGKGHKPARDRANCHLEKLGNLRRVALIRFHR